ncbi:CAP domain-containing protein [Peredibacter starrii]|uniref:CAP domain-containing protein n=1 Tax=Peredibacter starrii TaxID=28202 RepID=A0AAX4HK82_9BACT|nr:CAP domain-containing protein [Peredibacter starrii]WPU63658.1 CAP domain-containing protein [Peredibacter starrii]
MKILILSLFFLVACKTPTTNDFNPLDSYLNISTGGLSSLGAMGAEYMDIVNVNRGNLGLPAFIDSDAIEAEATKHAENMAKGLTPFGTSGNEERCARIKTAMGQGVSCGEMVARGPDTPEELFALWAKSDSSRTRLMSTKFTHSAIGLAKDASGNEFWVQIFLEVP